MSDYQYCHNYILRKNKESFQIGENMNTRFVMNIELTDNETNTATSTQMEFDSWVDDKELPTIIEQFSMFLLSCGYQPGSIAKYINTGA